MKIGIPWVLTFKYHCTIIDTIQLLGLNTIDQAKSIFMRIFNCFFFKVKFFILEFEEVDIYKICSRSI